MRMLHISVHVKAARSICAGSAVLRLRALPQWRPLLSPQGRTHCRLPLLAPEVQSTCKIYLMLETNFLASQDHHEDNLQARLRHSLHLKSTIHCLRLH